MPRNMGTTSQGPCVATAPSAMYVPSPHLCTKLFLGIYPRGNRRALRKGAAGTGPSEKRYFWDRLEAGARGGSWIDDQGRRLRPELGNVNRGSTVKCQERQD
jgi:hypothetical protein